MIAATHTASSTRVHASHRRNSRVGYLKCGRASHQILDPSGIEPTAISASTYSWNSLHPESLVGIPVRGKPRKTVDR